MTMFDTNPFNKSKVNKKGLYLSCIFSDPKQLCFSKCTVGIDSKCRKSNMDYIK